MLLDPSGEIEDIWPSLPDDAPLPDRGYVLVPPDRMNEARRKEGLYLGLVIDNAADAAVLTEHFERVGLISITFPSFADGRGFSIAVRLRALGFGGRLRASGPVIADQFAYLLSCGFDEVAIPDALAARQPVEHWLNQLGRISQVYQRGRLGKRSILDQRRLSLA